MVPWHRAVFITFSCGRVRARIKLTSQEQKVGKLGKTLRERRKPRVKTLSASSLKALAEALATYFEKKRIDSLTMSSLDSMRANTFHSFLRCSLGKALDQTRIALSHAETGVRYSSSRDEPRKGEGTGNHVKDLNSEDRKYTTSDHSRVLQKNKSPEKRRNLEKYRSFESYWESLSSLRSALSKEDAITRFGGHQLEGRATLASPNDLSKATVMVVALQKYFMLRMQGRPAQDADCQVASFFSISVRSLQRWRKNYLKNGPHAFFFNQGKWCRPLLTDDTRFRRRCENYILTHANRKGCPPMRAADFKEFLNSTLIPEMSKDPNFRLLLEKNNMTAADGLSISFARKILKNLDFAYTNSRVTGYCDDRYRKDVQKYKEFYVKRMLLYQDYLPLWHSLPEERFYERFRRESPPEHWKLSDGTIEFSIDYLRDDKLVNLGEFSGSWSRRKRSANKELGLYENDRLLLFSQDETIYKSHDDTRFAWVRRGDNDTKHTKGQGSGIMVSGFAGESTGFITLTNEELSKIEDMSGKRLHLTRSIPDLLKKCGRGILDRNISGSSCAFFEYGKSRDGFWDSEKIIEHTKEFLEIFEWKYGRHSKHKPRCLLLFDWSSGHAAMAENALVASRMNLKCAGKQPVMHDTVIQEHYPNARDPRLRKIGATQHMTFKRDEAPYGWKRSDEGTAVFEGKPKGLRQILEERGIWKEGMTLHGRKDEFGKLVPNTSALKVMESALDFIKEPCLLTETINSLGHVALFTPKYHPELNFIERVWGRSKWFLRMFCTYSTKDMLRSIPQALGLLEVEQANESSHHRLRGDRFVVPQQLIVKFGRISRDYVRTYATGDCVESTKEQMKLDRERKRIRYHRKPRERENHF